MYLPSLPVMAHDMAATDFAIQSTVLIYLIAYGLGQIFAGPLVDGFGRRIPAILGALLMAVASVGITQADSIALVLVLRVFQGIGGALTAVAARCVVPDCYAGIERVKAANWMSIAWACGPILSPVLGGYLQEWFNWHATFWALGGWSILVMVTACVLLPETHPQGRDYSLRFDFGGPKAMLSDRTYLYASLAMGGVITVIYSFEVLAPFYIEIDFKHSPIYYSRVQLCLGLLWLAGNLANRFLLKVAGDQLRIYLATLIGVGVAAGMIVGDLSGFYSLLWIAIPSSIIYFSAATIWPNLYAICLGRFPNAGGSANGLVSGMFNLISALFSVSGALLHSATAWPLWTLYLVGLGAAGAIFVFALRSTLQAGIAKIEEVR